MQAAISYAIHDTGCPQAAMSASEDGTDVRRLCMADEHAKWRDTGTCALCAAMQQRGESE